MVLLISVNKQAKVAYVVSSNNTSNLMQYCLIMNPHNVCNKIATFFFLRWDPGGHTDYWTNISTNFKDNEKWQECIVAETTAVCGFIFKVIESRNAFMPDGPVILPLALTDAMSYKYNSSAH